MRVGFSPFRQFRIGDNPEEIVFDYYKAIAKKAGVEGAELYRYRKTHADTLREEGVSVNTIPSGSVTNRWM